MRRLLGALIVLLVLLTGFGIAAHVLIDRSALRQDVIAAVKRQTGRDLEIGHFSVQVFPWPSFAARDVTLSDLPGSDRPPMLRAREVHASLALTPLIWRQLRLEHVVVTGGTLTLRRAADGTANWNFAPPERDGARATTGSTHRVQAHWKAELGSASIMDTGIDFQDLAARQGGHVTIDRLELDGLPSSSPYLDLQAHHANTPFTLTGHIGPLSVLTGKNPPWAVSLGATLGAESAHRDWVNIDGQINDPRHLQGISGTVRGELAHLNDLSGVFPHADLPAINGLGGEIGVFDVPALSQGWHAVAAGIGVNHIHLHMASAPGWNGVQARQTSIDGETLSSPLTVTTDLQWRTRIGHVQGQFGTLSQALAAWHTRLGTPLPVAIEMREPGKSGLAATDRHDPDQDATISLRGTLGAHGTQLALDGHAQGFAIRGATLTNAALKATLGVDGTKNVQLRDLSLSSQEVSLTGTAGFALTRNPDIHAVLEVAHLDMDALSGLWRHASPPAAVIPDARPAPDAAPGVAGVVASAVKPTARTQQAPTTAANPDVSPASRSLVEMLRGRDGDIRLHIGTLRFNGQDYSDLLAHAVLRQGHLTLDPLSGHGASGALSGVIDYDASQEPAVLSFRFAPFLLPATLAEMQAGLPLLLRGPLEAVGELHAQGGDRAALLASASGHLGLSMVGGNIDGRLLGQLIGHDAQVVLGHGDVGLRCLGVHMQIDRGKANLDTIGMQAGPVAATGSGTIDLATQELALNLIPRIGFGSAGASTPVSVGGTLGAPMARQAAGQDGRFEVTLGGAAPDPCGPALNAAREGLGGDAPPEARHHSRASDFLHALGILH